MRKALVIAPHADDETLSMGGTIARLAREGWAVTVAVMTGHGEDEHPIWPRSAWDQVRGEAVKACALLGAELVFEDLPASCLDRHPAHDTNARVAALFDRVRPEAVYIPFVHDLHRDHYELAYAAQVARMAARSGFTSSAWRSAAMHLLAKLPEAIGSLSYFLGRKPERLADYKATA